MNPYLPYRIGDPVWYLARSWDRRGVELVDLHPATVVGVDWHTVLLATADGRRVRATRHQVRAREEADHAA